MVVGRYTSDLQLAAVNLWNQKTRTVLTALGIIFGVGAVIGMLAIGAGAREQSLSFIEQLGVHNLLVESRPATSDQELSQRRRSSPGLTERDVRILVANLAELDVISARKRLHPTLVFPKPSQAMPELYGVQPAYGTIHNWQFEEGKPFDEDADKRSRAICVLAARGRTSKILQLWMEAGKAKRS